MIIIKKKGTDERLTNSLVTYEFMLSYFNFWFCGLSTTALF